MSLFRYGLKFHGPWKTVVPTDQCTIVHMLHFHSFIHSDHFYSSSSSPLLLISAPDTARMLCWSFTPKHCCCLLLQTYQIGWIVILLFTLYMLYCQCAT